MTIQRMPKTGTFYEINVHQQPKQGAKQHVFATDSCIRSYAVEKIDRLVSLFREKFPESEGYEITVTGWQAATIPWKGSE